MDWQIDLLTTYTHLSEPQVITALSLISTLYKTSQHPLSHFPACCVFNSRSLTTASNSGDSSASHAQVLPSPPSCRTQLSTELVAPTVIFLTPRRGPRRQHLVPCCIRNRCRGNEFTESLLTNGSDITAHLTIIA
jgi:hypothetical protein